MKIQFIGIGGVGISALAKWALHLGHKISGINDSKSIDTLGELYKKGVDIKLGTEKDLLSDEADLYVYSTAWLQRAPELMQKALDSGKAKSYFEALGDFAKNKKVIAVSGAHGKTTTTAMLHKILKEHGFAHDTIVGSKLAEEGSNFVPMESSEHLLVEACEYRRHFLYFYPEFLIVTNIEEEHLDYYKDLEDIKAAFKTLGEQVSPQGKIIANFKDEVVIDALGRINRELVDWSAFVSDVPELKVLGEHNIKNAAAAMAAAAAILESSFNPEPAKKALQNFSGTWRRFEFLGSKNSFDIISDYAHHPTEIKATLQGAKTKYKKVFAIFEPHTFSRVHKLQKEFAESFKDASQVFVLPIYAAREDKVEGINNKFLVEKINKKTKNAQVAESVKEAIDKIFKTETPENSAIVLLSAGPAHDELKEMINENL